VLKGGVLLAAYGLRRPTADIDGAALRCRHFMSISPSVTRSGQNRLRSPCLACSGRSRFSCAATRWRWSSRLEPRSLVSPRLEPYRKLTWPALLRRNVEVLRASEVSAGVTLSGISATEKLLGSVFGQAFHQGLPLADVVLAAELPADQIVAIGKRTIRRTNWLKRL
jgi:hypothetical protein